MKSYCAKYFVCAAKKLLDDITEVPSPSSKVDFSNKYVDVEDNGTQMSPAVEYKVEQSTEKRSRKRHKLYSESSTPIAEPMDIPVIKTRNQ